MIATICSVNNLLSGTSYRVDNDIAVTKSDCPFPVHATVRISATASNNEGLVFGYCKFAYPLCFLLQDGNIGFD